MTFLCQLQAFNTNTKVALAFAKKFRILVLTAIFLDKFGVFYSQRHLTAYES